MDESIALVEFSKHGRKPRVETVEYAHIEVGLKVWNPHRCYAAPFACHLALFAGEHSRPRRWAFLAFVVAGGLLCVFGTYYSVLGVVEAASSYTIFGGSCRLAAERA